MDLSFCFAYNLLTIDSAFRLCYNENEIIVEIRCMNRGVYVIHRFLANMVFVIAVTYLVVKIDEIVNKKVKRLERQRTFVFSSLLGIISLISMIHPFIYNNMDFDLRTVPAFYVAYLYGWKYGLVSIVIPLAYIILVERDIILLGKIGGFLLPLLVAGLLRKRNKKTINIDTVDIKEIVIKYLIYHLIRTILVAFFMDVNLIPWLNISFYILLFSVLALIGLAIIIKDAQQKDYLINRLKKGAKINEAFQNAITQVLMLTDAKDRTIVSVNKSGANMFNLTPSEMIGRTIYDYLNDDDISKRIRTIVREVKRIKKPVSFEQIIRQKHMKVVIYPVFDDTGDVVNLATFGQDITQIKEADELKNKLISQLSHEREKLSNKNEELEIANKAKDLLMANVSHELKTPLNIIMSYIEYMLEEAEGELNKSQKEIMDIAYRNSERLKLMIDNMLEISNLELNRENCNYTKVDLRRFIENLLQEKSLEIKGKNIKLESKISENYNTSIYTNPMRLRQVLENIINNAIKFTAAGYIKISLMDYEEYLNIYIEDTGIGIKEKDISKIFEPFYQGDTSTKKKYDGVGLGLSISKKIIDNMGGNIKVINNKIAGCTFVVTIPY